MNILLSNDFESLTMTKSRIEITTGKLFILSFDQKSTLTDISTVM